ALDSVAAMIIGLKTAAAERLATVSRVMLYPAVFLLAAGIFIGAVWANQSWGRYWGWDPKETWALITMIVYAVPLHAMSFPRFNRAGFVHTYFLAAFLSVLITYFGVNFFLSGLHSYA
ncbi:MAG: cytochrome c biogenesis protein CcsA, partial [Duncaniella sp.]|nr:cytochrome c biogenesis protein CcsA [Duncaniella sp.]